MISRTLFAVFPKRARESGLFSLLSSSLQSASPPGHALENPECAGAPDQAAEHNWTAGLCRGHDLPLLRLSILPQPGARMSLRFESCRRDENC